MMSGQVSVGPGVIKKFMLKNSGTVPASMMVSTIDPNGAFMMLSGSKPIPAGGALQVMALTHDTLTCPGHQFSLSRVLAFQNEESLQICCAI